MRFHPWTWFLSLDLRKIVRTRFTSKSHVFGRDPFSTQKPAYYKYPSSSHLREESLQTLPNLETRVPSPLPSLGRCPSEPDLVAVFRDFCVHTLGFDMCALDSSVP